MKPTLIKGLSIFLGVVLVGLAAGIAWVGYQRMHSPLDVVSIPQDQAAGPDMGSSFNLPLPSASTGGTSPKPLDQGTVNVNPPQISADYAHSTGSAPVFFQGFVPDRLRIPAISLDAPVVPTMYQQVSFSGRKYLQWLVPYGTMAGWQDTSALLGIPGNTVFNGHNNGFGEVFKNLDKLNVGDMIVVYSGKKAFIYKVAARMILPERFEDVSIRLENARWLMPSDDQRLTLVTCWPADDSTNRLIVVAFPYTPTPSTVVPRGEDISQ
jgi:LPXTG-site transpeptidase (sortase) family protein